MNNGFITLHRKLMEWEWYTDVNTCHLFIHMLLKANHDAKKWRGQEVKRGQLISGRFKLASETGLTEQQVRTSLKKLENSGVVTSKSTNQNTTYTIENYDNYQSKQPTSNQPNNQRVTNEQPTSNQPNNQRVTTNNNNNNNNNENNENNDNNIYNQRALAKESFAVHEFNKVFGTNYKQISSEFINVAHLYSEEEIVVAINNARVDDFWQDKATPLNIFKPNNLEKLINQKPKITTANKMLATQDIEW